MKGISFSEMVAWARQFMPGTAFEAEWQIWVWCLWKLKKKGKLESSLGNCKTKPEQQQISRRTNNSQHSTLGEVGEQGQSSYLIDQDRARSKSVLSLNEWKACICSVFPPKLTMVIHFFDEQILSINWNHVKIIKVMKKQI